FNLLSKGLESHRATIPQGREIGDSKGDQGSFLRRDRLRRSSCAYRQDSLGVVVPVRSWGRQILGIRPDYRRVRQSQSSRDSQRVNQQPCLDTGVCDANRHRELTIGRIASSGQLRQAAAMVPLRVHDENRTSGSIVKGCLFGEFDLLPEPLSLKVRDGTAYHPHHGWLTTQLMQ